ncbi:hypothetical protein GCM10011609_30320 [Lentzea pudingi]|uniref:Fusaric acid resistance protein-like n=1 Tax=Lentzea pudingi TaxID=1789439 RepID=A0ABQ2HTB7_9PSEU|nr:hypothetical protein GCM10011609_30320 [Lentzea pudingi]
MRRGISASRAKHLRARLEPGRERYRVVHEVAAEHGVPVDLDRAHHRKLDLRLVRDRICSARWETAGAMSYLFLLLTVGTLIAQHFKVSSAHGVFISLFGVMLVGLPAVGADALARGRFRRVASLFFVSYNFVIVAAAALIVYGEFVGKGPVHALVGHPADNKDLYVLVHAALTYACFVVAMLVSMPIEKLIDRHRRFRSRSMAIAVDTLFRCVESARDEKSFMDPDTRNRLITQTQEVALVLKHGLWRTMRVRNPLASREFRRRCVHAGQSIELLCVKLVLPDRTTHRDYLHKILTLADTLLSGRYGELPDDPERASYVVRSKIAMAGRFVGKVTVGLAPLAVYLLLRHFKLVPAAAEVPVLTLCIAWLATYGLNALSRHDSSSQFPNVLGIFGSTK